MKTPFRSALCILACLILTAHHGIAAEEAVALPEKEAQAVAERSIRLECVDQKLDELEDEDQEVRERAEQELLSMGPAVAHVLKKALETRKGPEIKVRAERILSFFEEGGQAVNGLKVKLVVERKTVKANEELAFKITLKNITKKDVNILRASNMHRGDLFENGSLFEGVYSRDDGRTIYPNLIRTIPAYSAVTFEVKGTVLEGFPGPSLDGSKPRIQYPLRFSLFELSLDGPGLHTLKVILGNLKIDEGTRNQKTYEQYILDNDNIDLEHSAPLNKSAPVWTGTSASNGVQIQIEEK